MCDRYWDASQDQDSTAVKRTTYSDERDKGMPLRYRAADRWKLGGCPCLRQRHTQRRKVLELVYVSLAIETTTDLCHLPGCPYAKTVPYSGSKAVKISYGGLRRLISAAIIVSFSLETGAGGRSISPRVTLRPVVDREVSPTFRIMDLLNWCSSYKLFWQKSTGLMLQVMEAFMDRIIRLYESRKSSPWDTNIYGHTVLHIWAEVGPEY